MMQKITATQPKPNSSYWEPTPTRDALDDFERNIVADFIAHLNTEFDARFSWHGNCDRKAIDARAIQDMVCDYLAPLRRTLED